PLGDGFIALVKVLIGPIIFCTVVLGIAGAGDMKKVGRVGAKALLYFEVVSTAALLIGLVVVNTLRPGAGFNADRATLDAFAVSGSLLQVLFVAILFGYALTRMGEKGRAVHQFIEECSHIFFAMMNV